MIVTMIDVINDLHRSSCQIRSSLLTVGSVVGWGTDSAMTIGWGWGRTACGRGNNHILANKIANSNLSRCCDGGQVTPKLSAT